MGTPFIRVNYFKKLNFFLSALVSHFDICMGNIFLKSQIAIEKKYGSNFECSGTSIKSRITTFVNILHPKSHTNDS
jgi:hypothetical protein